MIVKFDESIIPSIEDETIEVEHLLAEPKNEHVLAVGDLSFDNDDQGKCLKMKDVSWRFEDSLKANNGWLDSNTVLGWEDDLDFRVLDGFLDTVDELKDIHTTDGLPSPCDDYLLDVEFDEDVSALYCIPREGSPQGNSSAKCRSPGFGGASNDAVGVSESIPEPECQNDMHDLDVICQTHDVLRTECKCQAIVKDNTCQMHPASLDPQDLHELENDVKPFVGRISYHKKKKSIGETSEVQVNIRQKRMCKPIKRYINESSDPKSIGSSGRPKNSLTSSRDKRLKARSSKHRHTRVIDSASVKKEFVKETSTQEPSEVGLVRGCQKKQPSISEELESDEEDFTTESEDDSMTTKKYRKGTDRRKHQRMWTFSEVTNLVDGISQYGVGRWTDIKRLLFSSSTYRTPMDLRDKWRNLLRTCHAQKHIQSEVWQNPKRVSLPTLLLDRISELASIHPYPGHHKLDISPVNPPTLTSSSKVIKFNPNGRNVRRKKCRL